MGFFWKKLETQPHSGSIFATFFASNLDFVCTNGTKKNKSKKIDFEKKFEKSDSIFVTRKKTRRKNSILKNA